MKKILTLCMALLLLTGCGGAKKARRTVYAMDTVMTLTAYGGETLTGEALEAAETELRRLDALLSVSQETSDIYRANRDAAAVISAETGALVQRALDIAEMTGGAYDPTVYPLVKLWGFISEEYHVPTDAEMEETLPLVDYTRAAAGRSLTLPAGGGVDLGGIAKGYAAERLMALFREYGLDAAVVSLGGNVGVMGEKPGGGPWSVAVRNPQGGENDYIATLELRRSAAPVYAVTSGAYERYFEREGVRYHHILDPGTGYPSESDILSVTVVSEDGALADGLSTALYVMGYEEAVSFWRRHQGEFGMVLVTEEGLFATKGLAVSSEQPVTCLEGTPCA